MTTRSDSNCKKHEKDEVQKEKVEKNLNRVRCHNVKHVTYHDTEEYILYSNPIVSGYQSKTKRVEYYIDEDGKQYNAETGALRSDESIEASINSSLKRTRNKVFGYALANDWTGGWFLTITLNKKYVDRFNYEECHNRVCKFLKNVKEQNPDFKYLLVPQLHEEKGWHFHGVVVKCDKLTFENSGIVKDGIKIYNVNKNSFKYGFTTASKIVSMDKVINYFTNRIIEELFVMSKTKHRYIYSRNLVKPKSEKLFVKDLESMELFLSESEKHVKSKKVSDKVHGGVITYIKYKKGV